MGVKSRGSFSNNQESQPANYQPKGRHLELGRKGEEIAQEYFQSQGMELVAKNWQCKLGELDLIFRAGAELVFVEVKTRIESPEAERYLFDTIHRAKRKRLRRLVNFYLSSHYWRRVPPHRVDALGVIIKKNRDQAPTIRHLVGVVSQDD